MRVFINLLWTDFRRAFGGIRFWALTAGTAVLLFCNTMNDALYQGHFEAPVSLVSAVSGSRAQIFTQLMLILAALAYALSFCEDWKNRNIRNIVVRSNPTKYAVSKLVICAVSAFAVLFLGDILFVCLQSFFVSSVYGKGSLEGFQKMSLFDQPLAQGRFAEWVTLQASRFALEGAVFASLSLAVSTVMTNSLVVLTFPVFAYLFVDLIAQYSNIPYELNMRILYESDNLCIGQSIPAHMLWTVAFTVLLCAIFGYLFLRGVRRKFENG